MHFLQPENKNKGHPQHNGTALARFFKAEKSIYLGKSMTLLRLYNISNNAVNKNSAIKM